MLRLSSHYPLSYIIMNTYSFPISVTHIHSLSHSHKIVDRRTIAQVAVPSDCAVAAVDGWATARLWWNAAAAIDLSGTISRFFSVSSIVSHRFA